MSFNTFYLNSGNIGGIIDGSNVVIGGRIGVLTDTPQYALDVSGTSRSIKLFATTAIIDNLEISGETVDINSIQTKVEGTQTDLFNVLVDSKTSNAANNGGSSSGYFINNIETPFIHLTPGKTYRFVQSDSTNSSHPILFYLDENKTSQYSTGVTTSGSAGQSSAYVEIQVTHNTPEILYYQCQNHAYMGNKIYVKSSNITTITSVGTVTSGTWNAVPIEKQYINTQSISITDLSDVSFNSTDISDNQTLTWNTTNQTWDPSTTISIDTINENTDTSGVTIDSVLLKDNTVTAHTVTAQNYSVGGTNFISASRQGNFRDLEVKNSSNSATILLTGDGGDISIDGTLSTDNISEKTDTSGVTIDGVLLKDNIVTAHTVTAQNYSVGGTNFISASRQGNFRDLEVKNSSNSATILLTGDGGDISIDGTLSTDNISEKTNTSGVTIDGVLLKDGSITATGITQSAGDNTTQLATTQFVSTAVSNLVNGAPGALDTLSELASALDNSGNFATNVTNTLGSLQTQIDTKQATLTAGTNITITGTTISASGGGGGLTDLSATSISDLSDVSLNGIQVDQSLKWDGEKLIPYTLGTTATSVAKQGQVLETLAGVCDGRTVVVESGSYTLGNVTAYQDTTASWADVTGSSISYTPPSGTKQVIFEFYLNINSHTGVSTALLLFKLLIDGNSITSQNQEWHQRQGVGGNMFYRGQIDITGTDDIANGNISSWSTNKTIKLQVVSYSTSLNGRLHVNYLGELPTGLGTNDILIKPRMKITSIGESSGQAVTLTSNSVNDLSDISFNSTSTTDGQALVWNSTDGVWEAGAVASSGGGGLTDLSATSISDLSDVSLNGIQTNQSLKWDGEKLVPYTLGTTATSVTKQGQVLETLAGVCDGRTVVVESGSYTLGDSKLTSAQGGDNTLGSQVLNETWQTVRGSEISYLPPSGTKQVIFKFHVAIKWNDPTFITLLKLSIDSTDNVFFKCIRHDGYAETENTFVFVIDVGSQNSISNGQFLTWNTSKTLKLQARNQASSNNSILFQTDIDSNAAVGGQFIYPTLEIVAIGESSGQAVTLTSNSVNDLSDISFNSTSTTDGQALVWNSTDSVWEAGAVASSGGGGLTDLSATSISDLSDVSFNSISTNQGSGLIWNNADKLWEPGTLTASITNTTTTVINSGGWVDKLATNTPSYDFFGDTVYDGNDTIYFVGGRENSSTVRNYVWGYTLSTNTWAQVTTTGSFHTQILEHAVVYYNNCIYVFGGWTGSGSNLNDLYKLDLTQSTPTWSLVSTGGSISGRRGQTVTMYNSKLIVFGGFASSSLNDVYEIDLIAGTPTWTQLHSGSGTAPSARYNTIIETYQNKFFIFSGSTNDQQCWEFDLTNNTWSQVSLSGTIPTGRVWSQHTIVDNNIYLYGGGHPTILNDFAVLNVLTGECSLIAANITVPQTRGHGLTYANNKIYLYGNNQSSTGYTFEYTIPLTTTTYNPVEINKLSTYYALSVGPNYDTASLDNSGSLIVEGNVGIGISDPSGYKLEVAGDISFNGNLYQNGALFTGGSTIDETTDVSLNNLKVHGDLSANDVSFNVIDAASINVTGDYQQNGANINTIYATIASPTLTGTPAAPTASSGTNTTQLATTAFVSTAVSNLVNGAPGALDTLSELASALDNSGNFATNVTNTLGSLQTQIDAKQATLTFNAPSSNNTNPSTSAQIKTALDAKQDTLTAGTNITITGTTISASGGGGGLTDLSASSISDLSDVSLNGIQTNQSLKWDGEKLVPYTLGTTATSVAKQGQVLETLAGVCDGRTIVVESGSYTLGNVTAYQDTTHTGWTDVTGSSISYTPPTGSKQVIFEFHLNLSVEAAISGRAILLFKLLIDGTSVTSQNQEWGDTTTTYCDTVFYRGIIDITGTNDVANGKLSSWTSNKTLKLQVVNYNTYAGRLHAGYMAGSPPNSWTWDGTNLIKPRLKITTIGESSGQAVTLTSNSVNDLSDISFNPTSTTDGQALVWNSTDSVWEAGAVASSGGGLTDLSASSISDLSDVSFNSISTNQGSGLIWNNTDKLWEPGTLTASITNTTTTTTVTNSGGWVDKNPTNMPFYTLFSQSVSDGNDKLYFAGGKQNNSGNGTNHVWEYTLSTNSWAQLSTTGVTPAIFFQHTTVFYNNAIYTFAGWNLSSNNNTLHKLDLSPATPVWSVVTTSGSISARRDPRAALYGSKLVTFGGYSNSAQKDLYEIDLAAATPTWTLLDNGSTLSIPAQYSVSVGVYQDKFSLIAYTDYGNSSSLIHYCEYDLINGGWSEPTTTGAPTIRFVMSFTMVDDKFYLYGGVFNGTYYNNFYVLDVTTKVFTEISSSITMPNLWHCALSPMDNNTKLILYGGMSSPGYTLEYTIPITTTTTTYNPVEINKLSTYYALSVGPNYDTASLDNSGSLIVEGNVGIGISDPSGYKLEVAGDISFAGNLYKDGSLFTGSQWTTSSSDIYYNSGNVGIGTTDPSTILTIKKPIDSVAYGSGTRMIDFKSYMTGYDEATVKASIYCGVTDKRPSPNTQAGYMAFMTTEATTSTPTERMRIEYNGNVGIGTTSPSYRLHVNGSVGGSSFTTTSDDRIKHNEVIITNALSILSNINPKRYFKTTGSFYDASHNFQLNDNGIPIDNSGNTMIINKDYKIEIGIIAQEMRVIPELQFAVYGEEYTEETITTYRKDNSGNDVLDESGNKMVESVETQQQPNSLGVDYNSIHCTHIAATKELHQLVQTQQTTIEEQQQEIEHLKLVNQDINVQLNTAISELQTIKHYLGI